jgi:hypothetical protein
MSNTARGIDVRQSGQPLLFDAAPVNATTGAAMTSGTMTAQLSEVQSDGTLKAFDFSTNAFVANTVNPTTATISLTPQTTGTTPYQAGYWSAVLATTTGLTAGGVYIITFNVPAGAAATPIRKIQWGLAQGDLAVTSAGVVTVAATVATLANQTSILTAIGAITTNTARGRSVVSSFFARPTTSNTVFEIDVQVYSLQGQLEAPDAAPTVGARNAAGTSLSAALGSTTMTLVSTGKYKVTYTVNSTDPTGQVFFDFAWAVGGVNFGLVDETMVEDAESLSTLAAIVAKTSLLTFDGSNNVKSTPQTSVVVATNNDKSGYSLSGTQTFNVTGNVTGSVGSVTGNVTVGGYASGQSPAVLVLDVAASSHNTAGTIGANINTAAAGGGGGGTVQVGSYASGQDPATLMSAAGYTSGLATGIGTNNTNTAAILNAIEKTQIAGVITATSQTSLTVGTLTNGLGTSATPPTGNLVGAMCYILDSTGTFKARLPITADSGTTTRTLTFAAPGFAVAPLTSDTVAIS